MLLPEHLTTSADCLEPGFLLADAEMKASILSADRVRFDDDVFKTIDGKTVNMLRAVMDFNPEARPSADQVLRFAYITQRRALSKEPMPGQPAKMAQVSLIACCANQSALTQENWSHLPAGHLLIVDVFATISRYLTLWPACLSYLATIVKLFGGKSGLCNQ